MKKQIVSSVALAGMLAWGMNAPATDYDSEADGDWGSDATWTGSGTPGSGDTATIVGPHDITVSSDQVFSGGGFTAWDAGGAVEITINAGSTLTLDGGLFDVDIPTDGARISGEGTFINSGSATVEVSNTGEFLLDVLVGAGRAVFLNQGAVELSGPDAEFELYNGIFTNVSGGVIRRTPSGVGTLGHHGSASGPRFVALSGSVFEAVDSGAELRFEMRDIAAVDPVGRATDVTFKGNGRIAFEGYWTEISGTIADNVGVELNGGGDAHLSVAEGTVYDVTGNSTGLTWTSAAGHFIISTGHSITNAGTFTNARGQGQINGPGEFVNAAGAVFRFDSPEASVNMFIAVQNKGGGTDTTFRNFGTFDFVGSSVTHSFFMHGFGGTFQNEATGVVRKDTAGKADFADVGGNGNFNNLGTVEVTEGEIEISTGLSTTSFTSSDITEGTWNVYDTGILDLTTVSGVSAGSLNTIGAAAAVRLGGAGPTFTQLTTSSLTVNGAFGVRNQYVKSLSGNLVVGSGGTLELGLEAADEGGTLLTGWDVVGNVDLTGGLVDVVDLGGLTVGTYRFLEWDGTRTGSLAVGAVPADGRSYSLILMDVGGGTSYYELEVKLPPAGTVIHIK